MGEGRGPGTEGVPSSLSEQRPLDRFLKGDATPSDAKPRARPRVLEAMGVEGKRMSATNRKKGHLSGAQARTHRRPGLLGIVVIDAKNRGVHPKPRMTAFIWGTKVTPPPTLPFGRWKSIA